FVFLSAFPVSCYCSVALSTDRSGLPCRQLNQEFVRCAPVSLRIQGGRYRDLGLRLWSFLSFSCVSILKRQGFGRTTYGNFRISQFQITSSTWSRCTTAPLVAM